MAADGLHYKEAVIIANLKKVVDNPASETDPEVSHLELDIPFEIYACNCIRLGVPLGYPVYDKPELEGAEVMANVHYRIYHPVETANRNDEPIVLAFPGYVEDYHTDPRVAVHQPVMEDDV
jgi:hypothetical protein